MTASELEAAILAAEDGWAILALDPSHEGACPCFTLAARDSDYGRVTAAIRGHCWRTCPDCGSGCAIHVYGLPDEIALTAALKLSQMDWMGGWKVVQE